MKWRLYKIFDKIKLKTFKENTINLAKMALKRPMPKFLMFSRFEKDLLEKMLIKATQLGGDEIL